VGVFRHGVFIQAFSKIRRKELDCFEACGPRCITLCFSSALVICGVAVFRRLRSTQPAH